jgi:NitT/TauT family transport system ATP-binding protein
MTGERTPAMAVVHHIPAEAGTDLLRIAAGMPFGSVRPMSEAPETSEPPLVRLDRVAKSFPRRGPPVRAVAGVDLDVARGEFVTLIGPSGCGKSTLLRLIGGLLAADDGSVSVAGQAPAVARRAKRFGFVPQTPALLPWRTVSQNARLLTQVNRSAGPAASLSEADTRALLDEVGLGDFLDAYPRELSGGMQQRVALVRAFALGAPILLMDEPFAALDEMTRAEMRYLLLGLWERHEATVLFVTHSIAEAVMLSDRVVVLTPRPARVACIEDVTLARPRHAEQEDTVAFLEHVTRIRQSLREGARQ